MLHVMGRPEACRKPGAEIRAAAGLMWREMQCLAAFAVGGAAPKPANVPGFRAKGSESERKPARKDRITVPVMSEKSLIKESFSSALLFCLNPAPLEINRHQS